MSPIIDPLVTSSNAFLLIFNCLPIPLRALCGLAAALFFIGSLINLLQHGR